MLNRGKLQSKTPTSSKNEVGFKNEVFGKGRSLFANAWA
jgi:hypothetical protein